MVNKHTKYAINREKFTFVFFAQIRAVIFCFLFVLTNRLKCMNTCGQKKMEFLFLLIFHKFLN